MNAYRGKMPDGSIADFALLLDYVSEIDGIERIRYTTSHPPTITLDPKSIEKGYYLIPVVISPISDAGYAVKA